MDELLISKTKEVFDKYSEVKLAYLFGSQARGDNGPMSDYDFAVYLGEKDEKKRFDLRLDLMSALSLVLKTDDVDVLVLNSYDTDHSSLKYSIITEGIVIKEVEPCRIIVENSILNEYFDFRLDFKKEAKVLN